MRGRTASKIFLYLGNRQIEEMRLRSISQDVELAGVDAISTSKYVD